MHDSLSALRTMCEFSGWKLSNLKANKLLYIAQMVHMSKNHGRPLVSEQFEAWDLGPVLPSVYHSAKIFGKKNIRDIYHNKRPIEEVGISDILKDAAAFGLKKKASTLVAITHWEHGAWAKNYVAGAKGQLISNDDIIEEIETRAVA